MYSVVVTAVTQPLVWVLASLLFALVFLRRRPQQFARLVGLATLLLAFAGWRPVPEYLLSQWEGPVPGRPEAGGRPFNDIVGIVVLGGMSDTAQTLRGHHHLQLNSAAERLTESLALARQNPHWKLMYTGGCGPAVNPADCRPEAQAAGRLYVSLGLAPERLILEDASSTTYENAIFSARLPGVDQRQRWLLLTSASHMRRSTASFRAAGWNVEPWPVDFEGDDAPQWLSYSLAEGLRKWRILLHEWIGYGYYRLRNRSV